VCLTAFYPALAIFGLRQAGLTFFSWSVMAGIIWQVWRTAK
jgi:hypothetical protein